MKKNLLKFKKLNAVMAAMPLMLLVACQSDIKPDNVQTDSVQTDNTVTVNETTDLKTTAPKNAQVETQAQAPHFSEFVNTLQGSWDRTTYPFGTIEFNSNQVKVTAGEGDVEPAKFEDFKISDECPDSIDTEASALAYDFLVVDGKRCNPIKLNDNTLSLTFVGADKATEYKRIGKPTAAATSAVNTIPVNFHGKWAAGKENCKANNSEQIKISTNKINFFKNEAELVAITQFEPTRLEAKFNYRVSNSDSTPYSYTLDLQNQENFLIMREYGDNARSGPIKYDKCS